MNFNFFQTKGCKLDHKTNSKSYCLEEEKTPNDGFGFCPNVTFDDNKALNDQGIGEGTNCHSLTQPQHELELDIIMGRNPQPPPPRNF